MALTQVTLSECEVSDRIRFSSNLTATQRELSDTVREFTNGATITSINITTVGGNQFYVFQIGGNVDPDPYVLKDIIRGFE